MSLSTSLSYTNYLPSLLARKIALGRYTKDGYRLIGSYEADRGWENLFTDYLANQSVLHRAGATIVDIGEQGEGKTIRPGAIALTFNEVDAPPKVEY